MKKLKGVLIIFIFVFACAEVSESTDPLSTLNELGSWTTIFEDTVPQANTSAGTLNSSFWSYDQADHSNAYVISGKYYFGTNDFLGMTYISNFHLNDVVRSFVDIYTTNTNAEFYFSISSIDLGEELEYDLSAGLLELETSDNDTNVPFTFLTNVNYRVTHLYGSNAAHVQIRNIDTDTIEEELTLSGTFASNVGIFSLAGSAVFVDNIKLETYQLD